MKDEISIIESTSIASEVISKEVAGFVEQYRLSITRTAKSILELACVVADAERNLSTADFQSFRRAIGADKSKDSYIKKLRVIASRYSRFERVVDSLPASYTTLYDLAKMSDDDFETVKVSLSPATTANSILQVLSFQKPSQAVSPRKTSSIQKTSSSVVIDVSRVSPDMLKQICAEINAICEKYLLPKAQVSA